MELNRTVPFSLLSKPPAKSASEKDFWFTVSSPSQEVMFGSDFSYTFHIFNNTEETRELKIEAVFPHTMRSREWTVTAVPNGETTLSGSDVFSDVYFHYETLQAKLLDEEGEIIGRYMLSFKGLFPSVDVEATPDKAAYIRGETVNLALDLQSRNEEPLDATLKVVVTSPLNVAVHNSTINVSLSSDGTENLSFQLPATAGGGRYSVLAELFDASGNKIGADYDGFDIAISKLAITPQMPEQLRSGANALSFSIKNLDSYNVTSGLLDATFLDPEGTAVFSETRNFAVSGGQTKSVDMTLSIPVLLLRIG